MKDNELKQNKWVCNELQLQYNNVKSVKLHKTQGVALQLASHEFSHFLNIKWTIRDINQLSSLSLKKIHWTSGNA